jgi:putrescine transport system substrate-binding protein
MKRLLACLLITLLPGFATAAEENVLHMYNWNDYIDPQVLIDFEEETGIKVVYETFSTDDELKVAFDNGTPYDVMVPSHDSLPRLISEGKLTVLDKSKLPNAVNLDNQILSKLSAFDAKNIHAIPYLWGAVGLAINKPKAESAFGGPLPESWSVVFNPKQSAKLASCGISILDASAEVFDGLMNYKGRSISHTPPRLIKSAAKTLFAIRPNINQIDSEEYIEALNAGELCVAVAWTGDALVAADEGQPVVFVVPEEGAPMFIDTLVIPTSAPRPDLAYQFINYLLKPQVAAQITTETLYPNANTAADQFLSEELRNLPGIKLDKQMRRRLTMMPTLQEGTQEAIDEAWAQFIEEPASEPL